MIIDKLRREIARHDRPENRINYQQFFKEKLKEPYGLNTPVLRKISNSLYREIKSRPKKEILDLCDRLLESNERYFRFFAFEWAVKVEKYYSRSDFVRFERWLKKYVDGWGSCDHLCGGPIGRLLLKYPELADRTRKWRKSKNRWLRRAAAVSLIVSVRKGFLKDEIFRAAATLLTDSDDLVQKGYGWALKEAANLYEDEVFEYVMKYKSKMPRTALRYAIEKMPPPKRRRAMTK